MEDVFASIISYNPDVELLCRNIKRLLQQVKRIVIVDNCSKNIKDIERMLSDEAFVDKVILKKNEINNGIAKALNQAFMYCDCYGCKWVLTLDQDSIPAKDLVEKLYSGVSFRVGVVGPAINYVNNEFLNESDKERKLLKEVDWIITSASLTSLDAWKKIGGFDDDLFIDSVDYDFCYRLKEAGYKILKNYNTSIEHRLGKLECKKILGKIIYVTNHEPFRKYYIVRNVIYLDKKLKIQRAIPYIIKLTCKIIFFESNKRQSLKYVIKGIVDSKKMIGRLNCLEKQITKENTLL